MKSLLKSLSVAFILSLSLSCSSGGDVVESTVPNTLSASEKETGWVLLFDGKTTKGWRNYNKKTLAGWEVVDGTLSRTEHVGDIVYDKQFSDFELKLEWKIGKNVNSGILIRAQEIKGPVYLSAAEMQILDSKGKLSKVTAGANYDMEKPSKDVAKPVGEWNQVHIIAKGKKVEFWFNGLCTAKYEVGSEDWLKQLNNSKFRKGDFAKAKYGTHLKGFIALQEHKPSGSLQFRNIKIKELN